MRNLTDTLARWIWPIAWVNLALNILIIGTGGAVRLTGSGLGCPTWPKCTDESLVATREMGIHGAIEFGNRTLTGALSVAAVLLLLAALGQTNARVRRLALLVVIGIPAQAILGGITVLTGLNPWIVAGHLLISMWIVAVCASLLDALRSPTRAAAIGVASRLPVLIQLVVWLVLLLGTIVTGSGPHSGDETTGRMGLDPQVMSHVHASAVYVLLALTLGMVFVSLRAGNTLLGNAAAALLAVEMLQAGVGFAQYFTGLPPVLVGFHMVLAACLIAVSTWLLQSSRARTEAQLDANERAVPVS